MSSLSSLPQIPNPPHPLPPLTIENHTGGRLALLINPTEPNSAPTNYAAEIVGQTNGEMKKLIRLEPRPYKFMDGKVRVIFTKEEDDLLAEKCRLTVVGKFPQTRPQIDKLRDEFKRLVPLKGSFKIGVKDWRHVFIDFTDEEDFKRFYGRRSMPEMDSRFQG